MVKPSIFTTIQQQFHAGISEVWAQFEDNLHAALGTPTQQQIRTIRNLREGLDMHTDKVIDSISSIIYAQPANLKTIDECENSLAQFGKWVQKSIEKLSNNITIGETAEKQDKVKDVTTDLLANIFRTIALFAVNIKNILTHQRQELKEGKIVKQIETPRYQIHATAK